MKLHYVTRKHVTHVELTKEGKPAIGIVPKGATKHGPPTVKSIQFRSVAHRSHCVAVGDGVLSVCGKDSSRMSRRELGRLLHDQDPLDLELEYDIREPRLGTSGIYRIRKMSVNIKKARGSFGFTLRKHAKKDEVVTEFPTISNITQSGPIDNESFLRAGDRLIQVDDQNLSWLSLADISNILEEIEEAIFLVEYSVGIVDACIRPGERTELEIECLDADLGMVLASSLKDASSIVIQKILSGSVAERCGVFNVGDAVLCINDISTAHLSASDANALIKNFKKQSGKLVFVPYAGGSDINVLKEPSPLPLTSARERRHLIPPRNSPASLYNWHFKRTYIHLPKSDRNSFDFQSKAVNMLRDVVLNISTLEQLIPFHGPDGGFQNREGGYIPGHSEEDRSVKIDANRLSQLEAMCSETKDSARIMAMHFIKNPINVSLVKDSGGKSPDGNCGDTGDDSYFTRSRIVKELTENLTVICSKKFISKQTLDRLLANVSAVDFDCYECYPLCLSAALTVQKVILLLSLNDPDLDAIFVINKLMKSVVKVDVPCEDCRTPWCSVSEVGRTVYRTKEEENSLCHSENIQEVDPSHLSLLHKAGLSSPRTSPNGGKANDFPTFNRTYSKRSGVNLNMADRSAYYNLTEIRMGFSSSISEPAIMHGIQSGQTHGPETVCGIQSGKTCGSETVCGIQSGKTCGPETVCGIQSGKTRGPETVCGIQWGKMHKGVQNLQNVTTSHASQLSYAFIKQPEVTKDSSCNSKVSECTPLAGRGTEVPENYTQNCQEKIHVDKDLLSTPRQEWQSEETVSRSKGKDMSGGTKMKSPVAKHASDPSGLVKNVKKPVDILKSCKTSPASDVTQRIRSRSSTINNTGSCSSSDTLGNRKMITSTMVVNLKDEGKGFGLEIGFLNTPNNMYTLPIIFDVEPDSAAAKVGVLLKGDRIVSINGQSLSNLTVDEFANLTREAFAGDEVFMTVKFDVALPEVRYGTFDIHFDKTVKTGLEFKDFCKGSPLVVQGVVKGSAAHRCGQLFAGDEILFTNCIRQEAFDSRHCSYTRTEMVLMTVRRERRDPESNPNPVSEESYPPQNPPTSGEDSFTVHRTSIHTVSGSNALVLEQHISLCRDRRLKDFGFLVGQNPTSGVVCVSGVRPGGPADRSKAVKKNDKIIEIDGVPVGNQGSSSLSLLLQAGDCLNLVTRRMLSCKEE